MAYNHDQKGLPLEITQYRDCHITKYVGSLYVSCESLATNSTYLQAY